MIQDHDSEIERRLHPENFLGYNPDEVDEIEAVEEFEEELSAGGAVETK